MATEEEPKAEGEPAAEDESPGEHAKESLGAAKAEMASVKAELAELRHAADEARRKRPSPAPEPAKAPQPPKAPEPSPIIAETFAPTPVEETPAFKPVPGGSAKWTLHMRYGIPWLSNVGWALFAAGLAFAAYAYRWSYENYPDTYLIAGLQGDYYALAIVLVGLALAVTFLFLPSRRTKRSTLDETRRVGLLEEAKGLHSMHRGMAWIGLVVFLLGVLLTPIVYRAAMRAGPPNDGYDFAGAHLTYDALAAIAGGVALLGLLLWLLGAMGVLHARKLIAAYEWTSAPSTPPSSRMPGVGLASPSTMGVTDEQVHALMQKVDTMLSTLPDEVVASFSKTPEADTYLKLLGTEPKK